MQPQQPVPKPEAARPAASSVPKQKRHAASSDVPAAQLKRAMADPSAPLSPAHIMQMQKVMGNRAVTQLMHSRNQAAAAAAAPVQKKEDNRTGLPDNLKSGLEQLSGMDMSDVKVHYNSDKPAQLSALAYAQGSDIHIGPGQERHLPHEGWHVVQQKQGRVQPTGEVGGVALNDHAGLETEADQMGARANRFSGGGLSAGCPCDTCASGGMSAAPAQRSVVLRKAVVQRVKLGSKNADALSDLLSDVMNDFMGNAAVYNDLNKLYALIDKDHHAHVVQEEFLRIGTAWGIPELTTIGDNIAVGSIRSMYYPSSFDSTARTNRDNYVTNNPGSKTNTWKCPGYGKSAHDNPTSDVTIDHVSPVATHWNTVGYKTDKSTRVAWFNDTKNHVMLCRSCNSSKGSGGVYYTKQPDPTNGFKAT